LPSPRTGSGDKGVELQDKTLKCRDCGKDFVFTAGEQLFFHKKQCHNAPKRCKECKVKHGGGSKVAAETQMHCSVCEQETTVPFRPTQGRLVPSFRRKRPLLRKLLRSRDRVWTLRPLPAQLCFSNVLFILSPLQRLGRSMQLVSLHRAPPVMMMPRTGGAGRQLFPPTRSDEKALPGWHHKRAEFGS
jgi:CxxC-x17-CxxC domain-containing protein